MPRKVWRMAIGGWVVRLMHGDHRISFLVFLVHMLGLLNGQVVLNRADASGVVLEKFVISI